MLGEVFSGYSIIAAYSLSDHLNNGIILLGANMKTGKYAVGFTESWKSRIWTRVTEHDELYKAEAEFVARTGLTALLHM